MVVLYYFYKAKVKTEENMSCSTNRKLTQSTVTQFKLAMLNVSTNQIISLKYISMNGKLDSSVTRNHSYIHV